ncbi:MAG: endonuclease III [Clostridia bacterium]
MQKKQKAELLYERLVARYPDATCSLVFQNPLQLLVATQLSAQCTDKQVNKVTPGLFEILQTASDFAQIELETLERLIHSTGFYKNKAKNIQAACKLLVTEFGGVVPVDMEALLRLPGVGRKTANVVRAEAFGLPGIVVDTHVGRIAKRIGLTKQDDPNKVEHDLMKLLVDSKWNKLCHVLIEHGRETCTSRNPKCSDCVVSDLCDLYRSGFFNGSSHFIRT